MKLIATFYSHFGAVRYVKICKQAGIQAKPMPVPRNLSSSCGTCVSYESDEAFPSGSMSEEIEQIVEVTDEGYKQIYRAENS